MVPDYMAKPNFPEKQTAPPPWGTWEELLLACAVARHGADAWDSVAAELRKRSSALHPLTPHACKQKFHDLRRRFARNAVVSPPQNDDASIPFLDELRRLRVAELRREVERYDLSIVSLETEVERLKEEREQSLRESGGERAEKPDLEERRSSEIAKPASQSPEEFAGKEASGEGSVHDKRASEESDSADLKETGENPEPAEEEQPVAGEKPAAVEDSYGGSSDTVAAKKAESAENGGRVGGDSAESAEEGGRVGGDSAESKGGRVEEEEEEEDEGAKEVSSSTSLTRKKEEEPDEPDGSEDGKRAHSGDVESQSLAGFLEILRSHKSGSLLERRREIQETLSYTNMIRQHIDFEMIRIRLEEGWYSGCKIKFFRDLMLVLNNAIVFFGKKAPESVAATELGLLVRKEMITQSIATTIKQDLVPKEEGLVPDSKPEQQPSDTFMRKPKISVPMNACRKRSSIAARAGSTSSSGPERNKEQSTSALLDGKPAMGWKQSDKSSEKAAEEFPAAKKGRKDRPKANTRSNSSKSSAGRSNSESNKNSGGNANAGPSTRGGGGASNDNSASKSDKKENSNGNSGNASAKKRSATNFLNRMKRGSPFVETSKDSGNGKGGAGEQRKDNGGSIGKGGSSSKQKEQATPPPPPPPRRASGGKQAKEPESPAKRSVGRPSKRPAAAAPTATPPAKRSRQSGETEVVASSRNAKKRSRK